MSISTSHFHYYLPYLLYAMHRRAVQCAVLRARGLSGSSLSHVDGSGAARMVDVSDKTPTERTATASGRVNMSSFAVELVRTQGGGPKGDVVATARLAGIMAAKRTAELIPLCHPIPLTHVSIDAEIDAQGITLTAHAKCKGVTGVEMEALTAVSVAALTVYDMIKAVDSAAVLNDIQLVTKTGGKRDSGVLNTHQIIRALETSQSFY